MKCLKKQKELSENVSYQLEKRFCEMLKELMDLNNISLQHTSAFKKVCNEKKTQIKNELNYLIKQLRKIGSDDPNIRRYL